MIKKVVRAKKTKVDKLVGLSIFSILVLGLLIGGCKKDDEIKMPIQEIKKPEASPVKVKINTPEAVKKPEFTKKEVDYILDLDDQLYNDLFAFAKKVGKAVEKVVPCKRIGMIVFGLDVPHAHIHLIPINKSSEMNFSSPKVKLSNEEYLEIAEKISEVF